MGITLNKGLYKPSLRPQEVSEGEATLIEESKSKDGEIEVLSIICFLPKWGHSLIGETNIWETNSLVSRINGYFLELNLLYYFASRIT